MPNKCKKSRFSADLPWESISPLDTEVQELTVKVFGRLPAICEGVAYCLKRDLNVDARFVEGKTAGLCGAVDIIIVLDRFKDPSCITIKSSPDVFTKFIALYEENYLSSDFLMSRGFNGGLPVSRPLHELVRVIKNVIQGENLFWDGMKLIRNGASTSQFDEQDFAIVDLLTKGYVNSEISEMLQLPTTTLKNRIASLKAKLGANTLIEACTVFKNITSLEDRSSSIEKPLTVRHEDV